MSDKFELNEKNLMLILSYLGFFALIPRFTKKDDPFIIWHSKNGLGLFILETLIFIIFLPFMVFYAYIFKDFGLFFLSIIYFFSFFILLAFHIFLIYKAINGEKFEIPYISELAQKL